MTLVSVCIPAHNHGQFLGEAISSALGQPVPGLEVIVCDDASTDDTAAALRAISDPRLRAVRHDRAEGVAATRNRCLAEASGRYIAWLDADDAYLPDSLAPRLAVLEQRREIGLVHTGFHVIDAAGRRLPDWPAPAAGDVTYRRPVAFRKLITSNMVTTSTVVVRRDLIDDEQRSARSGYPSQLGNHQLGARDVVERPQRPRQVEGRAGEIELLDVALDEGDVRRRHGATALDHLGDKLDRDHLADERRQREGQGARAGAGIECPLLSDRQNEVVHTGSELIGTPFLQRGEPVSGRCEPSAYCVVRTQVPPPWS